MKWITSKYTTNIYLATIIQFAVILFFYTIIRLFFYYINTNLFPDVSFPYLMRLLLAGLKFDISALCYINSLFILIRFLPLSFPRREGWWKSTNILFWITNGFFIVGNIMDAAYYRFTNSRTQASIFSEFGEDSGAIGILISYIKPYWYIVITFIILTFIFIFLTNRLKINNNLSSFSYKLFFKRFALMILVAAFMVLGMRGRIEDGYPLNISDATYSVKNNRDVNIVLNSSFTFLQSIGKHDLLPPRHYMPDSVVPRYYSPIHIPSENIAPFKKKNVMVIILEGIGNAFIGKFNDSSKINNYISYTPFLDSLCSHSLIFDNNYTSARSSIKGINSVLGGFPVYDIYYMRSPYSHNDIDGLPRLLASLGYESVFYCGCNKGSFSFENFSKAVGYNRFVGRGEYNNDADFDGQWGIYDDRMAKYILKDIDKFTQPFLVSWFTLSSHGPYLIPEEFRGKYKGCNNNTMEESVRYVDETLNNFFKEASGKSWFQNTLFVITADHANVMNQYPTYNTADLLYRVPLIFYTPDNDIKPAKNKTVSSQLDITPSILGYLNFNNSYIAFGKNLFNNNISSFAVVWIDNNYQLIKDNYLIQFNGTETTGFYNKLTDPQIKNNIKSDTCRIQKEMETLLKAYMQDYTYRISHNKLAWQNE